jgi:hypothetical protein
MGSLLRLDLLTHCSSIRFLTRQAGRGESATVQKAFDANTQLRSFDGTQETICTIASC